MTVREKLRAWFMPPPQMAAPPVIAALRTLYVSKQMLESLSRYTSTIDTGHVVVKGVTCVMWSDIAMLLEDPQFAGRTDEPTSAAHIGTDVSGEMTSASGNSRYATDDEARASGERMMAKHGKALERLAQR